MTKKVLNQKTVDWIVTNKLIDYEWAVEFMKDRVISIHNRKKPELVWLLEHPSIYTAGTSAHPSELKEPNRFPIFNSGRGGRYTYHGPGQRVIYVMIDLRQYNNDIRLYIKNLEEWIINTLKAFNILGERRNKFVGVWVQNKTIEKVKSKIKKIASIGVRVQKGITFHGISINLDPVLDHFSGIISCGIEDSQVTSVWELGMTPSMFDLDQELRVNFEKIFKRNTRVINT